jgi:hypothetical protein
VTACDRLTDRSADRRLKAEIAAAASGQGCELLCSLILEALKERKVVHTSSSQVHVTSTVVS